MNNRPCIYHTGDSASMVRLTAHQEMELITVIDVLDRASLAIRASGFCSRTCGLQGPGSNRWPSYQQCRSCQMTNGLSVFMGGNFHLKMRRGPKGCRVQESEQTPRLSYPRPHRLRQNTPVVICIGWFICYKKHSLGSPLSACAYSTGLAWICLLWRQTQKRKSNSSSTETNKQNMTYIHRLYLKLE